MVTLTLLNSQMNILQQQWHFEDKSIIRIGRSSDNDVVLTDTLVSRHHLELRLINHPSDSWQLINHGTNGTFLNGILISQSLITDGSLLQLAREAPP
jgi:serine/threonine-protein kinase